MYNFNRYQRQITLSEIGELGQQKLHGAKVLCVGAGGLGCPVLLYLNAAGIGTLGIIDDDVVSITNLHRQILYKTSEQGQLKSLSAENQLKSNNPDVVIKSYSEKLTTKNAIAIMNDYDIVVDATDNFYVKYLINDCAVKLDKPVIFSAINKLEAQLSVFWAKHGPCYRCVFPEQPLSNQEGNCNDNGVIGPLVGIMGSMQALEVIKLIINNTFDKQHRLQPLIGKLILLDASDLSVTKLSATKNIRCAVCSKQSEEIKLPIDLNNNVKYLNFSSSKNHQDCLFIDVRSKSEWEKRHIKNSLNIPLDTILKSDQGIVNVKPDKNYIVYCQSGIRALQAYKKLISLGYNNIYCINEDFSEAPETTLN
ncbi:MAG: HesA/MoeB/ThiF family protein [Rickettsiaceae bacterium]|nr:HesA/MoeB/ThiF family protein [Rickettsiaceae bacterium]